MVALAVHVLGANFAIIVVSQDHKPDTPLEVSAVRDQRIFCESTWLLPDIVQMMDEAPLEATASVIALHRVVVAPCMPTDFSMAAVLPFSKSASAALIPWPTLFSMLILAGVISAKAAPT